MANTQMVVGPVREYDDDDDFDFSLDGTLLHDYNDWDLLLQNNTIDTNTNTNTTDTTDTIDTTNTVDTNRGSKRARVDIEPELGASDDDLCQQYTDIRARYIANGCGKWFDGYNTYLGCHLEPKNTRGMDPKLIVRHCFICCRDVKTPNSKYEGHLKKCHPVLYNMLCLNNNLLTKMKKVNNLNGVLASNNRVLFNHPCYCGFCAPLRNV